MPSQALVDGLREAGLIGLAQPDFEPLAGGVSCDVWKVETRLGAAVVKQPLGMLRVEAEWEAPVERSHAEVRWLRRARAISPRLAPEVLLEIPGENAFVLRFIAGCPVWKDMLVNGQVEPAFAAQVGRNIAAVHSATAHNAQDRAAFPNDAMFRALRVDPFILHVARANPDIAPALTAIAKGLMSRKIALVHGDVSPKNILVHADGPIFLDAECAVFGDPAFDLAFCTTHLLLKAVWLNDAALQQAAAALVEAYRAATDWEDAAPLLQRAGMLTAALLLARIEGKSPAPYLVVASQRAFIRDRARALLLQPESLETLVADWKGPFR